MSAPPKSSSLRCLFNLSNFGKGAPQARWNHAGSLLCVCGSNGVVGVFDRAGGKVTEVTLESRSQCIALDWDKDGEVRGEGFVL